MINVVRKWVGTAAGMLLLTVAFAAGAQGGPEKLYALKLTAGSTAVGTGITITAEFRNISPKNANSSFNALRLVPPTGVTLTSAPAGCALYPNATSPTEFRCENLSPVGKGAGVFFTFTANVPASACGSQWNPGADDDVWSGSQVNSGSPFALRISPAGFETYTASLTSQSPSVVVAVTGFSGAPVSGETYPGTATVTNACGASAANVPVTYSSTNATVTPTAGSTTNANGVFAFDIKFGTQPTGSVTVNALGATDTKSFAVYQEGELNCADTVALDAANPYAVPDTAPGWAGGYRGAVNSKGDNCVAVDYTVYNTILTDNKFGIIWDTATQKNAALLLAANSKPEDVDATGWPTSARPKFGWKYNGSTPVYIDGLTCVAPPAPSTYGTVTAVGSGTIDVNTTPTAPATYTPAPPVPFVIAVDGKPFTVTAISGSTWTVTGTGLSGSDVGAFVASKFPLLPEIYATVGSVSGDGLQITVSSRQRDFPPAPFPITVPADNTGTTAERMLVTAVDANQQVLTVTRGHGSTSVIPAGTLVGKKIVSNPLPLIPSGAIPSGASTYYTAGTQAQMCVVNHGWQAIGINPTTLKPQIMWTMEWLDIGDGWVSFR